MTADVVELQRAVEALTKRVEAEGARCDLIADHLTLALSRIAALEREGVTGREAFAYTDVEAQAAAEDAARRATEAAAFKRGAEAMREVFASSAFCVTDADADRVRGWPLPIDMVMR